MDINVRVRLESPELMAAILALAEALPQMQLGNFVQAKEKGKAEIKETELKEDTEKEEPKVHIAKSETSNEEIKPIALEDVRAKLASLSQSGKQKEVKALIQKFGASKLTEIAAEKYPALLMEAEAI